MRAFMLADNKLAEMAGYDEARLAAELSELAPLMEAAGLDFSLTGYEMPEIDRLLGDHCERVMMPLLHCATCHRVRYRSVSGPVLS
jgi:hypothetical protein